MGALDFSGRQQLYYQLYNLLFQDIISGKYPVGCIIPAESELMNTYHVSRATARKAMEMLANDGLVSKKRGYGTFVISAQPNTSPQRVVSNAYQIQWSFAKQKIYSILADKEMAELLHIAVGSPLLYIRRISFDKDNHPRECVCTYYRADTYHLEIELAI